VHPTILQKAWKEVSYEKALEKVMHRLREKDNTTTKNEHHASSNATNEDFAVAAAHHVRSNSQLAHQQDAIYSDQSDDFDTLVERIADPYDIGRQECPR